MNDAGDSPRPFQFRLIDLLVGITVIGLVLALLIPLIRSARENAREQQCGYNLRQIHVGLWSYYDVAWSRFPPSLTTDASGTPVHSWRALIWNFVEKPRPNDLYDLSEPWDGPNNSRRDGPWRLFQCASDPSTPPRMTNYVAVVGPGAVWTLAKPPDDDNADSSRSGDILIVEIRNSNIHWMEPRDLSLDELEAWADPQHQPRLGGNHARGGHVLFADGRVELLSRDDLLERLRAMATQASH